MGLFFKDRERRQHPRYSKSISVHINNRPHRVVKKTTAQERPTPPPAKVTGKDISRGGLCFYSKIAYEPGTVLATTIKISNIRDKDGRTPMYMMASSVPVQADVRVVWCKALGNDDMYEVGVEFMEIYGDDENILDTHLEK